MKLGEAVVVITGATSGIGRATALECARRGAIVAALARNGTVLDEVISECRHTSPHSFARALDVTDAEAVEGLAREVGERFGRIDAWVNNAAVTAFGRFEEIPLRDFRQVVETNLWGYVYGARAALPFFREQDAGTLVNVSSIVGVVGQPFTSPYVISKFAIRGLSESLYQELKDSGIHVCTVLPGTVDTPLFDFGANFSGYAPQAMEPVSSARDVARAIVRALRFPRREVHVGAASRLAHAAHRIAPGTFERLFASTVARAHFQDRPAPPSDGNLFEPARSGYGISGGWRHDGNGRRRALPVMGGILAGASAATAGWLLLRRRH